MVTTLVVIYDSACGGCSGIVSRLPDVISTPTLFRSCRDRHVTTEYPVLAGHLGARPCRRPLMVLVADNGAAEVSTGLRMMVRAAKRVAPGQRWAAVRLAATVLMRQAFRRAPH